MIKQQQKQCIRNKLYSMAYYQQNMLSIKSRTLLANILAEVVLISESLQLYREALARVQHFDSIALFRYLDREEKGYLRQKDFQRAIGTSHRKLLTYAFSWFDNMKVGEISRLEFAGFLLPKQNLQLRELVAKRVQNPGSIALQGESIMLQFDIFSRLVVQIMNREMRIIELRRELVKNQDYTFKGVMSAVDGHKHQWICAEDLAQFLQNFGFDANLRQLQKLVEVINNTLDGKITEQQLRWTVEGFQAKNKAYLSKIKDSNQKQAKAISSLEKDYLDSTTPLPQVRQFTEQQTSDLQLKAKYQKLLQSFNTVDENYKITDQLLINEALEIENQFDKQSQKYIAELRERKEIQQKQQQLELRLAREKQLQIRQHLQLNKETYLYQKQREYQQFLQQKEQLLRKQQELQELQQLNLRTAYLKGLAQKQLGFSNTFYINTPTQLRYSPSQYAAIYSHSTQKQYESPLRKKDYSDLSRLSKLTQVESFRKPTERSSYQPSFAERSPVLQEANHLRQMIKKQREIQKQIQSRFTSGKFNGNKYSSHATSAYASNKINQKPIGEAKSELIYESPLKDSPKFKDTGFNQFTKSTNKPSEIKT